MLELIIRKNKNNDIIENPVACLKKFVSKKIENVMKEVIPEIATINSGQFVVENKKSYEKEMASMISII